MNAAAWGLGATVLLASIVEMVEALTIVMAMGMTRSWRSTLMGVAAALVALTAFAAAAGYALATWLPEAALQLAIGGLLLIFGLQWLRKAILRSSGQLTPPEASDTGRPTRASFDALQPAPFQT
ncbi:hypothetical protein [Nonomuraea angiospora]|uniref:hypothetical protein n=1 Tax=Nonomuraea angiospora TaxID=46172 RepID=UPI0029BC494F|nr:hypothetical protein [Nonomuraea angiospora]MDX3102047.1 TMEM165/GDT1 family protein [Nonomuraea angiospora]